MSEEIIRGIIRGHEDRIKDLEKYKSLINFLDEHLRDLKGKVDQIEAWIAGHQSLPHSKISTPLEPKKTGMTFGEAFEAMHLLKKVKRDSWIYGDISACYLKDAQHGF